MISCVVDDSSTVCYAWCAVTVSMKSCLHLAVSDAGFVHAGGQKNGEKYSLVSDDLLGSPRRAYPVCEWPLSLPILLRLSLARYPNELSNSQREGT